LLSQRDFFFVILLASLNQSQLTLLFFDLGSGEIFLIVLAVILVFGPGKIPEIARGLGKFINEVKRASEDIKTEINREADKLDREKRLEAYKNSLKKENEPVTTQDTEPGTKEVESPAKEEDIIQ
jgi:TatA/E family protein of Tat protein translocase